MNKFELLNTALNGVERLTDIGTQAEVDALVELIEERFNSATLLLSELTTEQCLELKERIISAKQLKTVRFADESPLIEEEEEMGNEN